MAEDSQRLDLAERHAFLPGVKLALHALYRNALPGAQVAPMPYSAIGAVTQLGAKAIHPVHDGDVGGDGGEGGLK